MQAIQKVAMAEEWVKDTRNEARVEANLRTKNYKAFSAAK